MDRKVLAIEILMNGCPGAFIDFFFLTHKDLMDGERPSDEELLALGLDPERHERAEQMPGEAMRLLKDHLAEAEACQRARDVEGVYGAWEKAAQYFVSSHEYKTAAYFYAKCLHVATSTGWAQGQMDAHLNLGIVSERLGRMEDAVAYHERHLELAREHGAAAHRGQAERNLLDLYARQADAARARGDLATEDRSLRQMSEAARECGNVAAEGEAQLRIGQGLMRTGNHLEALDALRVFLEASRAAGDVRKEGLAHYLVGQCLDKLRRPDEALQSLREYRRLSGTEAEASDGVRGVDRAGLAEAACRMGQILFRKGEYREACEHFSDMWTHARAVGDRRRVATAKANLGVARGMAMRAPYLALVRDDLPGTLAWKSGREPFGGAQFVSGVDAEG